LREDGLANLSLLKANFAPLALSPHCSRAEY